MRTDTAVLNMPAIRVGDVTHAAHKLHRQLNAYDQTAEKKLTDTNKYI